MMSNFQKEEYVSPELDSILVEAEEVIATGSALVLPPDSSGNVQEQWDPDTDDGRTVEW
ncbi:hypothetical protein M2T82_13420 [Elizabethkingia ursingii]|uniref:hypothetical protein n=1 Tax=Elizabethkingia ursingii TaxID=1756150 RepID=UPI0020113C33|nr:hypothetical protein [Elizabethkingia ursingii]MCL1669063.1 hypothetical protein [Elizabethkingia ursingii]